MQWLSSLCYTAGALIRSHRGEWRFFCISNIWGKRGSCTHLLDRSGSNLVHWRSPPLSYKVPNFTFIRWFCRHLWPNNPQNYAIFDFWARWWRHLACCTKRQTRVHIYKSSPIQRYQNCFSTPTPSWWYGVYKLCLPKAWQTKKHRTSSSSVPAGRLYTKIL